MIKKYLKALSDIPRFPYICERWDKIINGKYELKIEEFIYSTDNDLFCFLDKEQALHSAIYYVNNLENNFSKIDETYKTEILQRLIKLFNEYLENLRSLDEAKDCYGATNVCEVNIAVFICVFCKYGYVKEVINELDQYNGKINLYCSDIVSSTLMTIADYHLIVKQDIEFSSVIFGLFDNLPYGEKVSKNAVERFYIKYLLSSFIEIIKNDNLPWNSEILLRVEKEFIEKYKLIKLQNKNPKLVFEQYLGLYYELSNKCRVIEETSKLRFNYICIMFLLQDMLEIVIRHDYSDICKIDNEDVKVLLDTVVKFAGKHNKAITELIRKCRLGNTIDEKALCFIVHNMFLIQDIVKPELFTCL